MIAEAGAADLFVWNKTEERVAGIAPATPGEARWWYVPTCRFAPPREPRLRPLPPFLRPLPSPVPRLGRPDRVVVVDYTRDPSVLELGSCGAAAPATAAAAAPAAAATVETACLTSPDRPAKLQGFADYLRQRGKAGVVRTPSGDPIFVFPGPEPASIRVARRRANAAPPPRPAVTATAEGAAANPSAAGASGASLGLGRQRPANPIQALREAVAARLRAFVEDDTATRLEFEPMDERGRFIVVEEVTVRACAVRNACPRPA